MKPLLLIGLLFALSTQGAGAERMPPRALPLPAETSGRVIVKFKTEAAPLREQALDVAGRRGAALAALERRADALGARTGLRLRARAALGERVQLVQADGIDSRRLAARLAQDAEVEYAEPDRRVRRTAVPNDPRFAGVAGNGPAVGQWYLRAPAGEVVSAIDAVSAWDTTRGSASIVVAVLDTGVRFNHPDLAGKLLPGYDLVAEDAIDNDAEPGRDADASDPGDWISEADKATPTFADCDVASSSWHGTQVAGLIGAATDNAVGMAGAGWDVRVLPVRVLGKCFGHTSDIVAGIRWAAGLDVPGVPRNPNPARVINLSLGSSGACSASERSAIAEANAAGAVVVVAAGNSAGLAANSPANCPGAIGVAALRHIGTKVGFSDVGPELAIAAPGGNCVNLSGPCLYPILTTVDSGATTPAAPTYTDSFEASVGTSYASPLVAATAALMLSAQASLTPAAVKLALQDSARPFPQSGAPDDATQGPIAACRAPTTAEQLQCYCSRSTCGAGMLDAGAAVLAATGVRASIASSPAAPVAGELLSLSAAGSTAASGRAIVAWQWSLVEAGGVAAAFSSSSSAATAELRADRAGTLTVHLLVTDDAGRRFGTQKTLTVAAATTAPATPPPATAAAGSGGGGAMSWPWLLGLLAASFALARRRARG